MGLTLTRAARWTSVDGNKGKLEYIPINEHILNEVTQFILDFPAKYADEAKAPFKHALEWTTENLSANMLSNSNYSQNVDGTLESNDKTPSGEPMLSLRKIDGKTMLVRANSIHYLSHILQVAKEKKLSETRSCLEANNDPIAKMLGNAYASVDGKDNTMNRMLTQIIKQESTQTDENKISLKIYMEFDQLDKQLLNDCLKKLSNEIAIRPVQVNEEIKLLQSFSGHDDEVYVLKSIRHVSDIEFNNGCRALPWRQIHGDITYLLVEPFDCPLLTVTCNKSGIYENNGITSIETANYDRAGNPHHDLISLIKEKSPIFKQNIEKKEFKLRKKHSMNDNDESVYEQQRKEHHVHKEDEPSDNTDDENPDAGKERIKDRRQNEARVWSNISNIKNLKNPKQVLNEIEEANKRRPNNLSRGTSRGNSQLNKTRDTSGESSPESDGEDELADRGRQDQSDLPSEYWQIQKLVKYLKGGNQTATIIALCSLRDYNLSQEASQFAIRDVGGLEVLINLLDTEDSKCKIGSLQILKEISKNPYIRRSIADLGGLQTLVKILTEPDKDLKCLAAETIANVAKFKRARKVVRQNNGINKLVALLDCATNPAHHSHLIGDASKDIEVARCGAMALWSLSKSEKNKNEMRKAGVIPLLATLLKSPHENMCIPIVGTLQECASEPSYRLAIRTEGMIKDLVENLKSSNQELKMHCANAIFKCAEDKETRDLVRKFGGLDPLVDLLNEKENKPLLAAATGGIWKCSISKENVKRFQELKTIESLVSLLNDPTEDVLINAVGALAECAHEPDNRLAIRKAGGTAPLVNLLAGTNNQLLVNTCKALAQCAQEPDNMALFFDNMTSIIERMDGVRYLWSLLKNNNPRVQAASAWAICPSIKNIKDSGETVRNFVGGLELIVSLLKSHDQDVLASVCAAVAEIAKDEENLAVITDHGVVPMLASLTHTTDDVLRKNLTEAIAQCCKWGRNREQFGKNGAVAPLVKYLKSANIEVHASTAKALHQLSKYPENCITMHDAGVVRLLLGMVGSSDEILQENAAGCISYIRRLAFANEKARFV